METIMQLGQLVGIIFAIIVAVLMAGYVIATIILESNINKLIPTKSIKTIATKSIKFAAIVAVGFSAGKTYLHIANKIENKKSQKYTYYKNTCAVSIKAGDLIFEQNTATSDNESTISRRLPEDGDIAVDEDPSRFLLILSGMKTTNNVFRSILNLHASGVSPPT